MFDEIERRARYIAEREPETNYNRRVGDRSRGHRPAQRHLRIRDGLALPGKDTYGAGVLSDLSETARAGERRRAAGARDVTGRDL
ncbi:MAG TPA: hypothetical protein EYO90_03480 [Candidatus Latescibacteria bacterium]|nr:hypothetical protein [Candidatus Latescibacterota bacterium]